MPNLQEFKIKDFTGYLLSLSSIICINLYSSYSKVSTKTRACNDNRGSSGLATVWHFATWVGWINLQTGHGAEGDRG